METLRAEQCRFSDARTGTQLLLTGSALSWCGGLDLRLQFSKSRYGRDAVILQAVDHVDADGFGACGVCVFAGCDAARCRLSSEARADNRTIRGRWRARCDIPCRQPETLCAVGPAGDS